MGKTLTTADFISKARLVHGDKYDYSSTVYTCSKNKVAIVCPTHGVFYQLPSTHLRGSGCPKCHNTIFGVGLYDLPSEKHYAAREKWKAMLNRCYYQPSIKRRPTYECCSVCDEWLTFSNFCKWFEEPSNGYIEGYHLDKDILSCGNKTYSPNTCCFVPNEINIIFKKSLKKRTLPQGVFKRNTKFEANIHKHGELLYLGKFNTPEEAFNAYKNAKERYIKEIAENYFQEGKITKKVYDALMKYEVDIND